MINFKQYLQELRNPPEIAQFKTDLDNKSDHKNEFSSNHERTAQVNEKLTDYFHRYGFKPAGRGISSTVFINPSYPYAIKVFTYDSGYMRYMQYCLKNQNNPYVPKFRGKLVKIANHLYATRIEKLTSIPDINNLKRNSKLYILCNYLGVSDFEDFADRDLAANKWLQALGAYIHNSEDVDLHSGNIMMRGDQPVVIDPFFDWDDTRNITDFRGVDISAFKDLF